MFLHMRTHLKHSREFYVCITHLFLKNKLSLDWLLLLLTRYDARGSEFLSEILIKGLSLVY